MTQPKHRPERETFIVHVGEAAEWATLPEWWGAVDAPIQSRQLRFSSDGSTWLDENELPATLTEAGARLASVLETAALPGLADPSLVVGQPVILRPEPHPGDSNAIAVWNASQQQVGYVLGEIAAEIMRESHRRRAAYKAVVAGEQRDAQSGERGALTVLLGPGSVWAEAATPPSS